MIDKTFKPNVPAIIKVHWRPNSLIPKYEINDLESTLTAYKKK